MVFSARSLSYFFCCCCCCSILWKTNLVFDTFSPPFTRLQTSFFCSRFTTSSWALMKTRCTTQIHSRVAARRKLESGVFPVHFSLFSLQIIDQAYRVRGNFQQNFSIVFQLFRCFEERLWHVQQLIEMMMMTSERGFKTQFNLFLNLPNFLCKNIFFV